jgi:methionyl aminopeptidase
MTIRSDRDLAGMRAVGRLVGETLGVMERSVCPGVTTGAIDVIAERFVRLAGARSAPQVVYGFPGFTLISVNDEIVHGIPGSRTIEAGDIVKLDVTLELGGYIADAARTVLVPPASLEARQLQRCVRAAFNRGSDAARMGRQVWEIGAAVSGVARHFGFFVVRELTGHGVGRTIHEPPNVPNYPAPNARQVLSNGLVITIEPLISTHLAHPIEAPDGWTLHTHNGALAAHHEHTILIRAGRPEVLTAA